MKPLDGRRSGLRSKQRVIASEVTLATSVFPSRKLSLAPTICRLACGGSLCRLFGSGVSAVGRIGIQGSQLPKMKTKMTNPGVTWPLPPAGNGEKNRGNGLRGRGETWRQRQESFQREDVSSG